jgi:preprotein translocase subunit SecA
MIIGNTYADWMNHIYSYLGLSVGLVFHEMTHAEKNRHMHVISHTNKQRIRFDYLRDNMVYARINGAEEFKLCNR